jgi:hypothetical protein
MSTKFYDTVKEAKQRMLDEWIEPVYGFACINRKAENSDWANRIYDHDNPNIFTAEFYVFLHRFNLLDGDDIDRMKKSTDSVEAVDKDGKRMKGIINRHPASSLAEARSQDLVSHDEYYGYIIMCYLCGKRERIEEIILHGLRYGYVYNNHNPYDFEDSDILRYGRQGHIRAFYKWFAGFQPSLGERLLFLFAHILPAIKKKPNRSSLHLAFIRLEALKMLGKEESSWSSISRMIYRFLIKRRYKRYAGPIFDIFLEIYQEKNHPYKDFARIFDMTEV